MALKKLTSVATAKPPTKETVPTVAVDNVTITKFNQAKAQLKDAEAVVEELEPVVKQMGLKQIFTHNVGEPTAPWTSVKLRDNNGEVARVSATSDYVIANADSVEKAFEELGKDVEDYAHFITKSAFDDKVFIVQENGGYAFSQEIYDAYKSAIDTVTATLKAQGKLKSDAASPLSSKQVVKPKPDFHGKRWSEFPSVEEQMTLQKALPMKVAAVNVK